VRPLAGGRLERVAQDLGYRALMLLDETEGEARAELDRIASGLAADRSQAGIERAIERYEALADEYVLPPPDDLFAVGYPLPRGYGSSTSQLAEGLQSACPGALEALGDGACATIDDFARRDPRVREPLAHRFARHLEGREPAASFARFEATICHAPPKSPETRAFASARSRGEALRLAPDARLVRVAHDVEHEGPAEEAPARRASYLVRVDEADEVAIYPISEALADAIEAAGDDGGLHAELEGRDALAQEGLLLPAELSL
jgi:hypothetical protein